MPLVLVSGVDFGFLGPKAYIASDPKGCDDTHGTTKLHLDVTDALNLMVWSATPSVAAALWHIFPAQSVGTLCQFLRETHDDLQSCDPIHVQSVYLSEAMLSDLALRYNVRPWVVHQRVGDVVFIPAGCAHQVSPVHVPRIDSSTSRLILTFLRRCGTCKVQSRLLVTSYHWRIWIGPWDY